MNGITPKTFPKYKGSSIFKGLSDYVKNPANFDRIQKSLIQTLATNCSHSEVSDYAKCKKCTQKMLERRKLLKKYGFKNPAQYMAWRKTHEYIKEKYPLMDWKTHQQINH